MLNEVDLADIRKVEPLYREGLTAEEIEAEKRECAEWDANTEAWRAAGNRPKSELPIDNAEARRMLMHRLRNKKYRKNKKNKVAPSVMVHTA
jgi:hypothetical protein